MACICILFEYSACTKSECALQQQRKVLASATYRLILVPNFCSFSKTIISFISQLFDHSCCDCTFILFIFYSLDNNLVDMNSSSDDEEASPDFAELNGHHGGKILLSCKTSLCSSLKLFINIYLLLHQYFFYFA